MVDVSVIIPTKNGAADFAACLEAIKSQDFDGDAETIVVDSGSRDETLRTAQRFSTRIIEIAPEEFTHGRSRNLGASIARGRYLVFCNQDAIPANVHWLSRLVEPLEKEGIAASYSRQIPVPGSQYSERVFLGRHYPAENAIHSSNVLCRRGPAGLVLFSTVAGALRRSVWEAFRFDENIIMSEDQEIALRLLKSGWKIAYQARSMVYHSNRYTLVSAFRRYFDSGWSMTYHSDLRVRSLPGIASYLRDSCRDLILGDAASFMERIGSLFYLGAKTIGFVVGQTAPAMPVQIRKKLSHTQGLLCDTG